MNQSNHPVTAHKKQQPQRSIFWENTLLRELNTKIALLGPQPQTVWIQARGHPLMLLLLCWAQTCFQLFSVQTILQKLYTAAAGPHQFVKAFGGNIVRPVELGALLTKVFLSWRQPVRFTDFLAETVLWELSFFYQKWQ